MTDDGETKPDRARTPADPELPRIPGYRLLSALGEGGMGIVYLAEQEEPRRRVAIKVLHSRAPAMVERFRTEAAVMARLDHPGIVRVIEAGEAAGHPFLVAELVDGQTLDKHVEKLSLAARLAAFVEICEAVHHAHIKGVIHRDLKPSNVMVRGDGRIAVLDFGVARLDEAGANQTRAGDLVGTPLYMSPEQASLRAHDVDARSDVYTLGVILYELASNELPYEARGAPISVITFAIVEDPPIPLGKRDPALRGDLEAIVGKALEKEPARRYPSVAALAEDVRHVLRKEPVSVRVPGTAERAWRFARRRPVLAAGLAGGALAAIGFAATVTVLWRTANDERDRAEVARSQLEGRTNQLVLRQARNALARDPTEAIAWLATLTPRDVDPSAAWAVVDDALALGVAHDVLRAHHDEVHWVEPYAAGFVTGAYDGKVIAWEPQPRTVFSAAHGRIHAVVPSPGGELAIGGDDGALHVVARDGSVLADLPGHAGDVQHLAWSDDGAWLATGDDHGNLWLWPHGRAPGKLIAKSDAPIESVAFGGGFVAAGDHAGEVYAWNLATGVRRDATAPTGIAAVSTDGKTLIAADFAGTVRTWSIADGLALEREVATGVPVKRVAFGPGWVALGGVDGRVVQIAGEVTATLARLRDQIRSLAISPDGAQVAFGSDDGELVLHALATGADLRLRGGGRVRHLAFARGGAELLASDSEGAVRRWDLAAIAPGLLELRDPAAHLASDGQRVAIVDAANAVTLWTPTSGIRTTLGKADGRVRSLALAGDAVVTITAEGQITWWGAAPLAREVAGATAIATSRDRVAVASSTGPIALFATNGEPAGSLAGDPGGTECVAFDASGTLLASGGQDRVIHLWRRDGDGFVAAAELPGPTGDTHFVAFSGDLLVSAGNDGNVFTWRVAHGAIDPASRATVAHHAGAVTALAVAPGWIASAGRDGALIRGHGGRSETAKLTASARTIVLSDDGTVHAVMRGGGVASWRPDAPTVGAELEQGARGAVRLDDGRWAIAYEDGAVLARASRLRTFAELAPAIAAATTFVVR